MITHLKTQIKTLQVESMKALTANERGRRTVRTNSSSSIYVFKLSALFRHVCLPMSSASQTLSCHFTLHVCGICDVSVECGACLSMHCIFKPAHVHTMIMKAQDWMRIMSSVYGESRIKIIISTKCVCVRVFCASAVTTTFWKILKYIHVHIL